ncbi:hypothetical protein MYA_3545 [Burkholderia sp. KJ006]|nr:hypothetical protein MYA_3545 [Burkholderia sp. KJ006]
MRNETTTQETTAASVMRRTIDLEIAVEIAAAPPTSALLARRQRTQR